MQPVDTVETVFVGSNPAVLIRQDGRPAAFASVWVSDWSTHGGGAVLVLVRPGNVRVVGERLDLARWIADTFVRNFAESREIGWEHPTYDPSRVDVSLELTHGMRARGGDVGVELMQPAAPRAFRQDEIDLGGVSYGLCNVTAACASARVSVGGSVIHGDADPAFLAMAEVWTRDNAMGRSPRVR
jgi:hypothetical protein